jgi:hypothetical protein
MSTPPIQFQKAVFAGGPAQPDVCAYCGRSITTEYFRVGGHLACPVCAQQAQSLVPPNSHKVFLHALSLGAAAAVVGCIGYALVTIVTGWTIGYAAIGVGYLIGWAMRRTAGQHGGRRYQWAAAALTYAAVAVAFVPLALHEMSVHKAQQAKVEQQAAAPHGPGSQFSYPDAPAAKTPAPPKPVSVGRFVLGVGGLLLLGLASPFLMLAASFGHGLFNAFILFIGCRYAWQMMAVRTVEVDGPFEAQATP